MEVTVDDLLIPGESEVAAKVLFQRGTKYYNERSSCS